MEQNTTTEIKSNLGKPTALVFSFDTTSSMSPCIAQVRQKLRDLVEMMTQDIPGLKIGLIAHGDYCDRENAIKSLDLTDDLEAIMNFINTTPNTSGGDAPECYELALNVARGMSWPAEGGSLVLIGDDEAHPTDYFQNTDKLDWKAEVAGLKEKNVNVFPMQCLMNPNRTAVNKFWEEVSGAAGTPLIILENFSDSSNTLEAVTYASAGAEAYDGYLTKTRTSGLVGSSNLVENMGKLKSWSSSTPTTTSAPTTPDKKTE